MIHDAHLFVRRRATISLDLNACSSWSNTLLSNQICGCQTDNLMQQTRAIFARNNNKLPVVSMFAWCISSRRHHILCVCTRREGMAGWCFTYRIMVKLCSRWYISSRHTHPQLVQVKKHHPRRRRWWWAIGSRLNIKNNNNFDRYQMER